MDRADNVSLLNVATGLVTELFEVTTANVGDSGSRAVRNWLCTPRPVRHIGQQAVFAFTATGTAEGSETRYGIFESEDGDSIQVTSSILTDAGWCPVVTVDIGGTAGMIGMGVAHLRRLQDRIVDPASKDALGLYAAAIEKRLLPLAA